MNLLPPVTTTRSADAAVALSTQTGLVESAATSVISNSESVIIAPLFDFTKIADFSSVLKVVLDIP